MKIAVISCIHGNYEALNAVLSDIDARQVDRIYCLGDLVGYGPQPNEVVEMIRSLDIPTCQGCWDEDIVEGLNACDCSYPSVLAEKRGRLAHEWTDEAIAPEVREYLAQLPVSLRHENLCFVHGSPHNQHEYLLPEMDAFAAMERVLATNADILFCGHTHIPYVRSSMADIYKSACNRRDKCPPNPSVFQRLSSVSSMPDRLANRVMADPMLLMSFTTHIAIESP